MEKYFRINYLLIANINKQRKGYISGKKRYISGNTYQEIHHGKAVNPKRQYQEILHLCCMLNRAWIAI